MSSTASTIQGSYERGEPWFDDGNIILQAGSTRFRVYRGALALNSPVFASSFPRNSRATHVPSSTAVYRLQDQPDELQHFLKALFIPGHYEKKVRNDFDATVSVLRLSTKYQVKYFRQDIVAQLSLAYPTVLQSWDNRSSISLRTPFLLERAPEILRLARDTDIRALIPAAMLACCSNSLETIMDGLSLSADDVETCILGRERILEAWRSKIFSERQLVSSGPGFVLSRHIPCDSARLRWLYREDVWEMAFGYDWFDPLRKEYPSLVPGMCAACQKAFSTGFDRARAQIWADLPGYFGLPEWSVLRTELDEILKEA
ncbi:hypothetical protein GLOTRDRAFT_131117 [Gloeophyllum trabeum ATCC 11539]|uniref:BTB domain-containing protein n=1 Tax=Gloeophyllum trabeum (strain ATCC 11539 / FP-39264 / Madison 617) TaxID=670483 RepID=S7RHL3_GLOTA|nr:uncharacterized protein GLOTRDRAFT_131117 [Gloeophyllum trabeum ATCC 11539]EPQ53785.1 hypothetical protein GLOTRDRAFT_131117 [Gloeophyllum trabeum ATCC 11539]